VDATAKRMLSGTVPRWALATGLLREIESEHLAGSFPENPRACAVAGGAVDHDLLLRPLRDELVPRQMLVLSPWRKASAFEDNSFTLDRHD
jgi:hypothetical protein